VRAVLGLALAAILGCGHAAGPAVQPDDHPPLPPSSGTPIGYLVDDATELALRDDQLTQLKTIDAELSARLDVLDTELRSAGPTPAASSTPAAGRHRGGHRGGGRRGGMGGGPGGGGPAGPGAGSNSARPSPSGHGDAAAVNRATEERATDVRVALERAFALFDPAQQRIAKRVLADRGVDLDAGRSVAPPGEAEPDSDGN
jgi:hypothetical protein